MQTSKITVDIVAYNHLLTAYKKQESPQLIQAIRLLEAVKSEGIIPNIQTYHILMEIAIQSDGMEKLLELQEQMQKEGTLPNVQTFNIIIRGLVRMGYFEMAMDSLEEMKMQRIVPNLQSYLPLISASHGNLLQEERTQQLMEQIRPPTFPSNLKEQRAYLRILSRYPYKAIRHLLFMPRKYGIKPNLSLYHSFLKDCAKSPKSADYAAVFALLQMKAFKIEPNQQTFQLALLCCKQSEPKRALVESQMKRRGITVV